LSNVQVIWQLSKKCLTFGKEKRMNKINCLPCGNTPLPLGGGRQVQYQGGVVSLVRFLGIDNSPPANSSEQYTRARTSLFLLSPLHIIAICICLPIIINTSARASDEFAEQYKAYQQYIKSASAAFQKKDYSSAITNYSKVIEMSPFEINNYYNRGVAYYKTGKEKEAEEDLDRVIIIDPRMSSAYVYRGLCQEKLRKYNGALNDYTKALELRPNDAAIHNNIAYLYVSANDESFRDNTKSLEHAKKAAELSKEKNAEILDTLARAYFINGQIKEAVEIENRALKLEPYNDEFKGRLKEYEEAINPSH
jgi:tetratricopeptide (TPR) repeat protein